MGFIEKKIVEKKEISIVPSRFVWIPGVRPVRVPTKIPIVKNKESSNNIFLYATTYILGYLF